MSEIFALTRNEYFKLRRRRVLWLLLALVAACSVALTVTVSVAARADGKNRTYNALLEESRRMVAAYESQGGKAVCSQEYYYHRAIRDLELSREDWRLTSGLVVQYARAGSIGNETDAAALWDRLEKNDYEPYLQTMISKLAAGYSDPENGKAATAGLRYCQEHHISPNDPLFQVAQEMDAARVRLIALDSSGAGDMDPADPERAELQDRYAIAKYRLEHRIPVYLNEILKKNDPMYLDRTGQNDFWDTLRISLWAGYAVDLSGILLAVGILTSEFGKGTIRLLLIAPVSRWKILLAKYLTLLSCIGLLTLALFAFNLLGAILSWGTGDLWIPILEVSGGAVRRTPLLVQLVGIYLSDFVRTTVAATFAFAVSALLRNGMAAVGVSLAVRYGGIAVSPILVKAGADWGRYLIFSNVNLADLAQGVSHFPHQSVGIAVVILSLHMAVLLLTAFDAFDRRDI